MTQPPYGQQPSGPYQQNQHSQQNQQPPYQQNQQRPPYQQQPGQPGYQYGPPSVAPQQGQGFGWGPQFAPPPGPQGYQQQGPPQGYPPQGPPPGQGFPPRQPFQQGPGFQPGWQQQLPPRKKSKAPLFAILGVVLVGVVGLWVFGVIKKNADNNYTQPEPTQPTSRVTEGPSPSEPTGSTEPTQEPTATEPTATEPTTTEPTSTEPTTTTTEKPTASELDVVAKNAIYRTGQMRTVGCREPAIRPSTAANAARYWAAIKPCLDQSWARQTGLAGFTFRAPTMLYWSGVTVSTPCGNGAVSVPFYCPSNHKMYMKVDNFVKTYNQYPDAENQAYARMWYSRSIAHEYGHAMQSVTGILEASQRLRYDADTYADRTRLTRRLELQANCFAGVFLAANKSSYPINGVMLKVWNKWVVTAGDKPNVGDHGSSASQARFMGRSFITGNPASCNTYTASAANVN